MESAIRLCMYIMGGRQLQTLTYTDAIEMRSRLIDHFKGEPNSINKHLTAYRQVARTGMRMGDCENPHWNEVRNVPGKREKAGRDLSPEEVFDLFSTCSDRSDPFDARDAVVLTLLRMGLRRNEVATLTIDDLLNTEPITLRVRGKRNKERIIPVPSGAHSILLDWLNIRGLCSGPLVGHAIESDQPLTGEGIRLILIRRLRQARMNHATPHDFRRTFIGDMLDEGVDIKTVADLAGQDDVTTTARYDRRPERRMHDAMSKLTIPSGRKEKKEEPEP